MVAQQATAPESAAPYSKHNSLLKAITPEPEPSTTCAYCSEGVDVYQMADSWICLNHIRLVVTLAACDIFNGDVTYTQAFEDTLW